MKLNYRTEPRKEFFNRMDNVYIELNEDVTRISVKFRYDPSDVAAVKRIKGRRWNPEEREWTVPMELDTARRLREEFGERLQLGPAVTIWARELIKQERNLRSLHSATDAKLEHTPQLIRDVISGKAMDFPDLPKSHALNRRRKARPYQRADIRMMSMANAINGNDVGTGKTLEAIAAIYEAQLDPKPILVVAPRRALVNVWATEFHRLTDYEVITSESPAIRQRGMEEIVEVDDREGLVLALIADDLRLEQYWKPSEDPVEFDDLHACKDYQGNWYCYRSELQKQLYQIEWGAFIIDEFHNTGLNNRRSLFFNSAKHIQADRRWPMSGTPIGGKARRLWPILNFIDSRAFSAEWNWIERWLLVEEETFYKKGDRRGMPTGKSRKVGGIKPEMEEAFYNYHKAYMTRRTKKDALPGVPDALEILIETPMSGRQLKHYQDFDDNHEIMLDGKRLSGPIVLAQYIRLRQMASSVLKWDREKPVATKESNKLDALIEKLDELGIRKDDWEPGARAYVGTLDISLTDVIIDELRRLGIACGSLTGKTKESKPIIDRFNSDAEDPYVIVMTIQTGGTALNLEKAGSAHAIDEAWDPDVMHQFFGRGDRGSRDTPLKCFTYRTPQSIQEYIAWVASDKKITNRNILNYAQAIEELRERNR